MSENLHISHRMSNGPKAFYNQTDLKHVQTTRYLGQKTFRLEFTEYTAHRFDERNERGTLHSLHRHHKHNANA